MARAGEAVSGRGEQTGRFSDAWLGSAGEGRGATDDRVVDADELAAPAASG